MAHPETPLLDAVAAALVGWQEASAARPVLVVDDSTFDALRDESQKLAWWRDAERGASEPEPLPAHILFAGYDVVIDDVEGGWEWRPAR